MANEAVSVAEQSKLDSGELLDYLYGQLQASRVLEYGGASGLIASLDDKASGEHPVGLTEYEPGSHQPNEIDAGATLANRQALAETRTDDEAPRKLYMSTEWNHRYLGATGLHPLHGLSRAAIAMTAIGLEKTGTEAELIVAADTLKPVVIADDTVDAAWMLSAHDRYMDAAHAKTATVAIEDTLKTNLDQLLFADLNPDSDACLIVSDFLGGANYDPSSQLEGFSWEKPLEMLSNQLGDRLYAIRLMTPAQHQLPYIHELELAGATQGLDMDDYNSLSTAYSKKAHAKAKRVAYCLQNVRHLELSTVEPQPFISLSDFIFGEPADA